MQENLALNLLVAYGTYFRLSLVGEDKRQPEIRLRLQAKKSGYLRILFIIPKHMSISCLAERHERILSFKGLMNIQEILITDLAFSIKSWTFPCLICALNLYFVQKLLRKAKFARGF